MIDNLPAISNKKVIDMATGEVYDVPDVGFPLGRQEFETDFFVNNHINIRINYTETS